MDKSEQGKQRTRAAVTIHEPLFNDDGSTVTVALNYRLPDGSEQSATWTGKRAGKAEVLDVVRGTKTTGREEVEYWQSDGLTVPMVYKGGTVVPESGVGEIKATDSNGNPLVRPFRDKIKGIIANGKGQPLMTDDGPVTVSGPVWESALKLAIGGSVFRWFANFDQDPPQSAGGSGRSGATPYAAIADGARTGALAMLEAMGIDAATEQGQTLLNAAVNAAIEKKKAEVAAKNAANGNAPAVNPETLTTEKTTAKKAA